MMDNGETPPILLPPVIPRGDGPPPVVEPPSSRPRWRWFIHLILLAGYVLGIGLIGSQIRDKGAASEAALPTNVAGLVQLCSMELIMFGTVFLVACFFSRPSANELFLKWRAGFKTILWGALYSILLRVGIAIILFMAAIPIIAYERATKGEGADPTQQLQKLRPDIESLIEPKALEDPLYLFLVATLVSFVVAGLREELWRAGMMRGLAGFAPNLFSSRKGQVWAVAVAAVIFGIGHFPQGLAGVFVTTALGFGLGIIIIRHQSIWEATLAHGFFNATSFTLLSLLSKFAPDALKTASNL